MYDHMLMEAYRPRLRRAALRLLKNENDADDIVQEAFARWYACPPRDTSCPEAWLVTVVRRLSVDAYRSRKRELLCESDALVRFGAGKWTEFTSRVEHEDDIAIVLQRLSERATTEECFALLLRAGFGYSYADLARTLSKTQEACRQLVHRGRSAALGGRPVRRRRAALPAHATTAFLQALRQCNTANALAILTCLTCEPKRAVRSRLRTRRNGRLPSSQED